MHHDVRTDDSREMNQNVRYTTFCSLRVEHCSQAWPDPSRLRMGQETLVRVRNEKIACHRFGWMVFQRVQCFDPNTKRTNRKTQTPSYL